MYNYKLKLKTCCSKIDVHYLKKKETFSLIDKDQSLNSLSIASSCGFYYASTLSVLKSMYCLDTKTLLPAWHSKQTTTYCKMITGVINWGFWLLTSLDAVRWGYETFFTYHQMPCVLCKYSFSISNLSVCHFVWQLVSLSVTLSDQRRHSQSVLRIMAKTWYFFTKVPAMFITYSFLLID